MEEQEKGLLSYDLVGLPRSFSVEKMVFIMNKFNIIFYDSFGSSGVRPNKPEILREFNQEKIILDYSTPQGREKLEEIRKIINEQKESN